MSSYYLPASDQGLRNFARNMSEIVTNDPVVLGLSVGQATSLASAYSSYDAALSLAIDPGTKTIATVAAKNTARANLKTIIKQYAAIIQAHPTVTNEQRAELGLTIRDTEPSPKPVPAFAPGLLVERVTGRTVDVRLQDTQNPDSRGRPVNVDGAVVCTHVGANPPSNINDWFKAAITSRTQLSVSFDSELPAGTQVWILAYWFNPRKEAGPACAPVPVELGGGVSQAA